MTKIPTIELPRLENEHPARYEARTLYMTMGEKRSLEAVSQKLSKSLPLIKRWSSEDKWTELAAQHDQTVYTLAAQRQADDYSADLADYCKRYGDMGKALFGSAAKMLKKINATLDTVEVLNPGTLLTVLNAAKTAADLEALSLRIEHLLQDEKE